MKLAVLIIFCAFVVGACSDSKSSTGEGKSSQDASSVARRLKASIPSVEKTVVINENNDPNDKIGRPGGYTSAAVLYDAGAKCSDLGVDCGATIEVYPSADEAQARSKYIQGVQEDIKLLGSEYNYLDGGILLRVSGDIKPSIAKKYEAVLAGG